MPGFIQPCSTRQGNACTIILWKCRWGSWEVEVPENFGFQYKKKQVPTPYGYAWWKSHKPQQNCAKLKITMQALVLAFLFLFLKSHNCILFCRHGVLCIHVSPPQMQIAIATGCWENGTFYNLRNSLSLLPHAQLHATEGGKTKIALPNPNPNQEPQACSISIQIWEQATYIPSHWKWEK